MLKFIREKSPYLADVLQFFKKPGRYLPAKKASFKDFAILMIAKLIFYTCCIAISRLLFW